MPSSKTSPVRRAVIAACAVLGMLVFAQSAMATFVRPRSATPFSVPLVVAYDQCANATGETHAAPLNFPSCAPPVKSSTLITHGDPFINGAPANFQGQMKFVVQTTPADVLVPSGGPGGTYLQDIRCGIGLNAGHCSSVNNPGPPDYSPGQLAAELTIRVTDNNNSSGGSFTDSATVAEIPFRILLDCGATSSMQIGATCLPPKTSFNAIIPGSIVVGKRMNVRIAAVRVTDGGPDGDPATSDAPNRDVAAQGVFVP